MSMITIARVLKCRLAFLADNITLRPVIYQITI